MTTWNAADKVGVALSGSDLIATDTGNASGDGVRSTTSKNSGKVAFSASLTGFDVNEAGVGISLSGASYTGGDASSFSLLYVAGLGYGVVNNASLAQGWDSSSPAPTGGANSVLTLLDSTGKLYFQCNGNNLFGADPAAGTGGLTIGTGAYFATAGFNTSGAFATADFTPGSLPSGFSDWDGGGGGGTNLTPAAKQLALSTVAPAVANTTPQWYLVGITETAVDASGNYTLSEPANVQENDILTAHFAIRSNVLHANADWANPQGDASGNTTNNTTGSIASYQAFYCFRGSSPPSYLFTKTGGSRCLGTVAAWRSSIPGVPRFDTSAELAMGAAGTSMTLSGGIVTAEALELLVAGVMAARANTVSNMDGATEVTGNSGSTDASSHPKVNTWTERSDRNNGTSPTVGLAIFDVVKETAGSTGNLTVTQSQSARHGMTVMAFMHPSAAGVSLSPAAKQLVLSTAAPSMVRTDHRNLSPAAVQLALSTVAPSVAVAANHSISPPAAQLVLSSAAPAVVRTENVGLSPGAAQAVLSTVAPSVVRTDHVERQPGKADLVLSTAAPQVGHTTGVNASPAAAQLVLSAVAPSVVQTTSANLSPAAGQLVLSAAAPSVSVPANVNISPPAAQLSLSSVAPSVVQNVRRDPAQGNLVLSTAAPSVVRTDHRDLSPAAAQLVLSSIAPGVQAGASRNLSPAKVDLVLSTAAPTVAVTAHHAISPPAAQLGLSSVPPARVTDVRRDIPQGNLSLTTAAPAVSVTSAQGMSPAKADLVLTTSVPSVVVDFRFSPAAAQLVLTRAAPSVRQDNERQPAARQLTLTTAAPTVAVTTNFYFEVGSAGLVLSTSSPSVVVASTEPPRTDHSVRKVGRNVSDTKRPGAVSGSHRPSQASRKRRSNVARLVRTDRRHHGLRAFAEAARCRTLPGQGQGDRHQEMRRTRALGRRGLRLRWPVVARRAGADEVSRLEARA